MFYTDGGRRYQYIAGDVPRSLSSLSALVQAESRRIPVEFFPSNPQEIEVDVWNQTYPFGAKVPKYIYFFESNDESMKLAKKKEKIKIQFQKMKGTYIFGQHPLVEMSPTATATHFHNWKVDWSKLLNKWL